MRVNITHTHAKHTLSADKHEHTTRAKYKHETQRTSLPMYIM